MNRRLLALVYILCILCAVIIGVFVYSRSAFRYRKDVLKSCSVSSGGGMLGGYSESSLSMDKEGNAVLTVRKKETHAEREVTTVYQVDPQALEEIGEMIYRYNLYGASKRPYSKFEVLDGETTTLSFRTEKGYFSISGSQVLTGRMKEGWQAVINRLHTLAAGEGVTTVEPQTAMLYLKSGYTLQFIVEDAFDSRLDEILSEEQEVSAFMNHGIVVHTGQDPDLSGADAVYSASAGDMVYLEKNRQIIILYTDYKSDEPLYILARLSGHVSSACPLIQEMEGLYRMYLN